MARRAAQPADSLAAVAAALSRTPQTAAAIAEQLGVHARTVKRALAKLPTFGVDVRVTVPAPVGRGRTAARYSVARAVDRSKLQTIETGASAGLDPARRDALRAAQGYRRTALDRGRRVAAAAELLVALPGWDRFLADARHLERRRRQVSRTLTDPASVTELEQLPRVARELVNALGSLEAAMARVQLGAPPTDGDCE